MKVNRSTMSRYLERVLIVYKRASIVVSIFLFTLILHFILKKTGIIFETNDDHTVFELLNGTLTGKPDYHTFHNNVIVSVLLSFLYKNFPSVSWYGLFMLFLHVIPFALFQDCIVTKSKKMAQAVGYTLISICLYGMALYMHARLQYTSTAMICALLGFGCLLLNPNRKRNVVLYSVLELISFGIRPESMEIMQPIGFCVFASIIMLEDDISTKERMKQIFKPLSISIGIIFAGIMLNRMFYSSPEWENAVSTHEARIELIDYHGEFFNDSVSNLLDQYNVSQAEYNAYVSYLSFGWNQPYELIEEISSVLDSKQNQNVPFMSLLQNVYVRSYGDMQWKYDKAILYLLLCEIVILVICGQKRLILANFAYMIGKGISWGYLYYKGRLPIRVFLPMVYGELLYIVLIAIVGIVRSEERQVKKWRKYAAGIVLVVCISVVSYFTTQAQYRYLAQFKVSDTLLLNSNDIIRDYCNENSQNAYILSNNVISYWKRTPFETIKEDNNYVYGGGWFSSSPNVKKAVNEYLDKGNWHFVSEQSDSAGYAIAEKFFEELYGMKLLLEDQLALDTGAVLNVYRLTIAQ